MDVTNTINVRSQLEQGWTLREIFTLISRVKPKAIYFPAGEYEIDTVFEIPRETSVVYGDGPDATVIRATAYDQKSGKALFYANRGNVDKISSENLRLNKILTRFDRAIEVFVSEPAQAEAIAADDILILYDDRDSSFADFSQGRCPQARGLHASEFIKVARRASINGNILTFNIVGSIQGHYKSLSNLHLFKMNKSAALTIRDFSLSGTGTIDSNEIALAIRNGRDISVSNIRLKGSFKTLLDVHRCLDVNIQNTICDQTSLIQGTPDRPELELGGNYGVAVGNSQNVTLTAVHATGLTHGLLVGGEEDSRDKPLTPLPINRQINVSNSHFATWRAGYDIALECHPNIELYTLTNNTCFGAIGLGGSLGKVISNDVYSHQECLYSSELVDTEHEIINNRFHGISLMTKVKIDGQDAARPRGGIVNINICLATNTDSGPFRFSDNRMICLGSELGAVMHAVSKLESEFTTKPQFIISNNYIYCDAPGNWLTQDGDGCEFTLMNNIIKAHT